ncbi:uncharacterized protein LOC143302171 [Babylonia areolata]|uniref:uncharacterized protein LOC143302171 n=1 Tax=Babylonia areolata TaxID=304850 RepID=UPI003FD3BE89
MPSRQPKQTTKRKVKQTVTSKRPKVTKASAARKRGSRNSETRVTKVKASWKPVSHATKKYVLHTFDSGVRLLTHKVSDGLYKQVHDAFLTVRNQVAASLETLRVPPRKHDYNHLSAAKVSLEDMKKQLEQRKSSLTATLENQEKELQKLQDEKTFLQDFGKTPAKHHPLLLEPMEKELHLNFDMLK